MRKQNRGHWLSKVACICLAGLLCASPLQAAAQQDYPDIVGHWSEAVCRKAVEDGLVNGYNNRLNPDSAITLSEILTILDRVLGTEESGDISSYGISETAWYREAVEHSQALKILSTLKGMPVFAATLTRADVFLLLVEAFQLMEPEPDISCLASYQDADQLTNDNRGAAAVLVSSGIVEGSGNQLMVNQSVTRAEFLTLLYRIIDQFISADQVNNTSQGNLFILPVAQPSQVEEPEESVAPSIQPTESVEPSESPQQEAIPSPSPEVTESEPPQSSDAAVQEPAPATDDGTTTSETALEEEEDNADSSISPEVDYPEESVNPEETVPVESPESITFPPEETTEPINSPTLPTPETEKHWAEITNMHTDGNLLFHCGCSDILFRNVRVNGSVLIRSDVLNSLTLEGKVYINHLTLASINGDVALAPAGTNQVETVQVGTGVGLVTLSGNISQVEVTGNNRTVVLRNIDLNSLRVSGSNNNIIVEPDASIQTVKTINVGDNNRLLINGTVQELTAAGTKTKVSGIGTIANALVKGADSTFNIECEQYVEDIDRGISNITFKLEAPSVVKAGGSLTVTARFSDVGGTKICSAQWYKNGSPVPAYGNDAFELTEGKTSSYSPPIVFKKQMESSVTVGMKITYVSGVKVETLWREVTVPIENYPMSHYYGEDASRVLSLVSSEYTGSTNKNDNKDYSAYDKTVFVNVKGYSSPTKYLVWVNRACQKTNIFEGSKGNWVLIRTCTVATGKASTPTPTGVFEITRKQSGWFTSTYTVKPVVRFSAGAGYAFHSRKYYPGTNKLLDARIGFPVSLGCIRMYDEDIQWMYYNLPAGTTVVVF